MNSQVELIGIYNANGGLFGELSYLTQHLFQKKHCALCNITHGMNPLGKASWKQAASGLSVPIRTLHLNERDARMIAVMAKSSAPVILLLSPEGDRILLDAHELEICQGDPKALVKAIEDKLSAV